jgi:two-component system, sensor histidine kinase and response regulator
MNPILVIDDEEMYREMLGQTLTQAGYAVLKAEDGKKGLEIALNQPIELIVCDVMMDNLDGFGLIERVRMDPATSTIPFVFVTGLSDRNTMRKGMSLGADDFLVKPFTGAELLSAVESRLVKHRDAVEEAERRLSQLRASISLAMPHEIRTPLATIVGFAQILGEEGDKLTGAEVLHCGKLLQNAGVRLQRLLENVVALTQIELIASDKEKSAFVKQSRLEQTQVFIRSASRNKAQQHNRLSDLELDLEENQIDVSEAHLEKILDELIDNAFKFSPVGSKVSVQAIAEKEYAVLTIADHGKGMTPAQISNLGAYVQFDRTSREQQGSGLGLTIARRLAEIHGGSMEFSVSSGNGLAVRVRLPKHSE